MKQSEYKTVNWRDFLRGMIMAVGTPVLYLLQELIPNYPMPIVAKCALAALITYLIKNFFTPADKVQTFSEEGDPIPPKGPKG